MTTDEILNVKKITLESGDWYCTCPHCKEIVCLPSGPIRGEQFQHTTKKDCMGWFDVDPDAKMIGLP